MVVAQPDLYEISVFTLSVTGCNIIKKGRQVWQPFSWAKDSLLNDHSFPNGALATIRNFIKILVYGRNL